MIKIKVVRKNYYFTVVAIQKILKEENILKLEGIISSSPTKYSIQIGEQKHLMPYSNHPDVPSSFFRYLNHSCCPNAAFSIPDGTLTALKDIEPDEDIVFNYHTTEYDMVSPFKCRCGSANCLNEIKGFNYLSAGQKKELSPYLAPHLKKYRVLRSSGNIFS